MWWKYQFIIQFINLFLYQYIGSGKTLSYLLPLIQTIKRQEKQLKNKIQKEEKLLSHDHHNLSHDLPSSHSSSSQLLKPKILILSPTRELGERDGKWDGERWDRNMIDDKWLEIMR